jgi:hypothetical protein
MRCSIFHFRALSLLKASLALTRHFVKARPA